VISITWTKKLPLNLQQLLQQIVANNITTQVPDLLPQLQEFFLQRIRSLLEEEGIDYDLINAILGEEDPEYAERALRDVLDTRDRAQFLQAIRHHGTLAPIYETVNRAARLAKQGSLETNQLDPTTVIQPQLLQQSSEQAFYQALVELLPQTQAAREQRDYQKLVQALAAIAPTVSRFFDGPESVLVMDENPEIRRNRLNLLGLLRNHARLLADFGPIVKS
jgi:glycyl-tRNA synthetase beta chain